MKEMLEAYVAAVRAKDVDAFLELYADDVRTFDLWSVWSYDGKAALRGMVEEWFGSLGTDLVAVEFDEVRSEAGEDVRAVSAFTTYRGLSAGGEELRSMNNRLTWVLRKDASGSWKIAHEHTSAPAGDGGKVQLKR
ncbi:MAG TPA: nuclear transport factor 2 family protein [Gaiellaceae bacterium]|nr:nuclear transport factor 2 family protein [Gaiellaceae bacterium]